MKKITLVLSVSMLALSLIAPAMAFAGGDQVSRPDDPDSATQQSGGDLPDWAQRTTQKSQP